MSYKTFFQILLVLAIISTICISVMKPKMHKTVMVYNSDYKINTIQDVQIAEKDIPVLVQNSNIQTTQTEINTTNQQASLIDNQPIVVQQSNINTVQSPLQKVEMRSNNVPVNIETKINNIKNTQPSQTKITFSQTKSTPVNTKVEQTKINTSNQKTQTQVPKIDLQKIVNNAQNVQQQAINATAPQVKVDSQKPITKTTTVVTKPVNTNNVQTTTQQPNIRTTKATTQPIQIKPTSTQTVELTPQQEEIAWNRWRSNLQNQIMKDVNMPVVPNGVIFKFTFDVDKYGKVSNVQTWSETKAYTPYAIQFIAPVIRSYQGHSILNFPTGSKRVTTHFEGAWRVSSASKYSTPDDYNDIEKIRK